MKRISVDATHAPMTVVVDPNAKQEKMPFKEQVRFDPYSEFLLSVVRI